MTYQHVLGFVLGFVLAQVVLWLWRRFLARRNDCARPQGPKTSF